MPKSRFSVKALDSITKAVFSEALELAFSQGPVDPLPPGHISLEKKERGGLYARWRRQGADGKPLTPAYLGPQGGEKHLAAQAQLEDLERIERSAKSLRRLGYAAEDNASAIVLAALSNAGVFSGGGALVGTRAFRCLTNHLGFIVSPTLATLDMDVARSRSIRLASPLPSGGMLELLKGTGLKFIEVPGLARNEPATSWRVVGKEIKLDLLVPAKGDIAPYASVEVPELGAHATALPYLDYLLAETTEAVAIGKSQLIPVRVPEPGRFCWHKIAVSQLRQTAFAAKAEKDLAQAACIAACMAAERLDELLAAGREMPAAMRKKVAAAYGRFAQLFGDNHRQVVEAMAQDQGFASPVAESVRRKTTTPTPNNGR